jgi:hypothetical protein
VPSNLYLPPFRIYLRSGSGTVAARDGETYCPARREPVASPSPPHMELIIPALEVEVLTTTVKYTGLLISLSLYIYTSLKKSYM